MSRNQVELKKIGRNIGYIGNGFPYFLSARLLQLVEHWTLNPSVMGLSPTLGELSLFW